MRYRNHHLSIGCRILSVLALALVLCSPVAAQNGLVAHWTLDEGQGNVAGDSSGFGHDGTLVNDPSWTLGNVGGALSLNGIDHVVVVDDSPQLAGPAELTLAAWIRHTPVNSFRAIIDKRDAAPDGYDLYVSPLGRLFMRVNREKVEGVATVADNTWRHVAGVYDGQSIALYVDGELDVVVAVNPTQLDTTAQLFLGRYFGGLGSSFQGQLDDVRIYDRALVAAEVESLAGPRSGQDRVAREFIRGGGCRQFIAGCARQPL